jgi:hypothetical protein
MPALPSLAFLLQIPLSEQVQETLTRVQEAPIIATVITVCVLLGIVLLFLEMQSKRLSSMLGSWLQIRGQLNELSTDPTATDLETTADRAKLLKAFHQKLEERLRDVLGSDQLIALSYEERLSRSRTLSATCHNARSHAGSTANLENAVAKPGAKAIAAAL